MMHLKITNLVTNLTFGWHFSTQEEAEAFLVGMQSYDKCPYKPIIVRDEEGNILSSTPHPDWEITITAL
jgi:hypothetical protein